MRPRVFPAEDPRGYRRGRSARPRFNEAAGIPRGRLCGPRTLLILDECFNEAAGIPAEDA